MDALSPMGPCGWHLPCTLECHAFSPSGRYLALATGLPGAVNASRTVLVVDTENALVIDPFPQGERVTGLGWVSDEALVVLRAPSQPRPDGSPAATLVVLAVPDGGELAAWSAPPELATPVVLHCAPAAGVTMVSTQRWSPVGEGRGAVALFQGAALEPVGRFCVDTELAVAGASRRALRCVLDPDGASVAVILGRWSRARGTDRLGSVHVRAPSGDVKRVPAALQADSAEVAWVSPDALLVTAREEIWLAAPGETAPAARWSSPRGADRWTGALPSVSIDREARLSFVCAPEEGRPTNGATLRLLNLEERSLAEPTLGAEPLRGVARWCEGDRSFAVLRAPCDSRGTTLGLGRVGPRGLSLEQTYVLGGSMDRELLAVSPDGRWLLVQYHDWVSELIDVRRIREG
ncbi:MAG: hypothetical protein HY909_14450 [Deltaproteobacteria bacterium]|nr:hypothetical protein [Deltaproteobacteria bacterium]